MLSGELPGSSSMSGSTPAYESLPPRSSLTLYRLPENIRRVRYESGTTQRDKATIIERLLNRNPRDVFGREIDPALRQNLRAALLACESELMTRLPPESRGALRPENLRLVFLASNDLPDELANMPSAQIYDRAVFPHDHRHDRDFIPTTRGKMPLPFSKFSPSTALIKEAAKAEISNGAQFAAALAEVAHAKTVRPPGNGSTNKAKDPSDLLRGWLSGEMEGHDFQVLDRILRVKSEKGRREFRAFILKECARLGVSLEDIGFERKHGEPLLNLNGRDSVKLRLTSYTKEELHDMGCYEADRQRGARRRWRRRDTASLLRAMDAQGDYLRRARRLVKKGRTISAGYSR